MNVAEKVRAACIKAAQEGFQEASMSGLCMEGAIESAVGSIQSLNLDKIIDKQINKGNEATDYRISQGYMKQELGAPRMLIGHSLGGAAVLQAAHRIPSVEAVVSIGGARVIPSMSHITL